MKKHLIVSLTIGACLLLPSAGVVFAGPLGTDTGQPGSASGVHCGTVTAGFVTAPGPNSVPAGTSSAFNGSATGPNGQPVGGGTGLHQVRIIRALQTRKVRPPDCWPGPSTTSLARTR